MSKTIDTRGRGPMLMIYDVTTEVMSCYGDREISDECAATIASWWQAPRGVGEAMAQLASTGVVRYNDLADDIFQSRKEATSGFDRIALDMLSTWALSKMREA